jgi:hypothetical protein
VVTLFDSKEVAIRQLRLEMSRRDIKGVEVAAVLTLIDRGRDTQRRAAAAGVSLNALVTLRDDGLEMLRGVVSEIEIKVLRDYIESYEKYQDHELRGELLARASHRK